MIRHTDTWQDHQIENMYAVQVQALRKIIKENQATIERLENTINELIIGLIKEREQHG